jgi:hypothetical protein
MASQERGLRHIPFAEDPKSSRALLQQAATAAEFADADLDELTAVLKQASRGRLGLVAEGV